MFSYMMLKINCDIPFLIRKGLTLMDMDISTIRKNGYYSSFSSLWEMNLNSDTTLRRKLGVFLEIFWKTDTNTDRQTGTPVEVSTIL